MKDLICCFIGHRFIHCSNSVEVELLALVEKLILQGYSTFLIGSHGDFDNIAFSVCLSLKKKYKDINIFKVLTNLSYLKLHKNEGYGPEVNTMFYPIEEVYFKKQIIASNQFMINDSDLVIAFVDLEKRVSGAKLAFQYAKKQKKQIINLFKEDN